MLNLNKEDSSEIIKTGAILFAITAAAALILGFTNSVTSPIIVKNQEQKQTVAMKAVLPEAANFSELDLSGLGDKLDKTVTAIYSGGDAGCAVLVSPNGYGGAVSMAVGVSPDGKVTGIDIISQSETAGLGANCTKPEFKKQFVGKTAGVSVVKQGASENQVDAISSATITSKAVTLGVNTAIDAAALAKEAK